MSEDGTIITVQCKESPNNGNDEIEIVLPLNNDKVFIKRDIEIVQWIREMDLMKLLQPSTEYVSQPDLM